MNNDTLNKIEMARRIAEIMGPSSGAAQACALYDQYLKQGFQSEVLKVEGKWLVKNP